MIKDGLKTDDLNPVVVVGDGSEDLLCSEGIILKGLSLKITETFHSN